MMSDDTEDTREYTVLVNSEDRYSLWLGINPCII